MEPKKSKYDTNPLDEGVVRETEEVWGEGGPRAQGPQTQPVKSTTRDVGGPDNLESGSENARRSVHSESPTMRYDKPPLSAPYPSVFVPPTYSPPESVYQRRPVVQPPNLFPRPSSRTVAGIGLAEKWAVMLPYTPAFIGLAVSIIELLLVPRNETKVRFHASQALTLHIAFLAIQTLFSFISAVSGSTLGGSLFKIAAFIFLIVSMSRVWKGKPHHIAPLAEPSEWFDSHINPRR